SYQRHTDYSKDGTMLVTKYDTHVLPEPRPRRRDGMAPRLRGEEQSSDASGSPDAVTVSGRAAHWLISWKHVHLSINGDCLCSNTKKST
ncbi:MAG: hypothetical protein O7D96_02200, partial [SAR324 cluster bacterium]|nr:hypothetical protein [SAR324 cluster bacterium]